MQLLFFAWVSGDHGEPQFKQVQSVQLSPLNCKATAESVFSELTKTIDGQISVVWYRNLDPVFIAVELVAGKPTSRQLVWVVDGLFFAGMKPQLKVIFDFAGGPRDGQTMVGYLGDKASLDNMATAFYHMTEMGKIGKRFKGLADYGLEKLLTGDIEDLAGAKLQAHKYEVKDRLEADGEVLIRCEFVESD